MGCLRKSVARRDQPILSVAMADLDHFKALNDTYGHETGDRALRRFAQVLAESVRAGDLVCRQGGEEFVMALPGCTLDKARGILDAVRIRLDAAITVAGLPKFTVSFGVVDAGDHEDLPTLLGRADAALFEAKRGGRDQVVAHDHSGHATSATDLRIPIDVDDRSVSRQIGASSAPNARATQRSKAPTGDAAIDRPTMR
jgi:diguanylate cyclase (GGDEF)-like protein